MGGSFTDIEKDVDAASTTACQCPPRSATRLSLAQPEASLVMVLEFFFLREGENSMRAAEEGVTAGESVGLEGEVT